MDNNTYKLDLKVLKLLDEFENKLENVATIPLTGKIMINREDFLEIIREINIILPEEYQHVKWIKSQKNQIIDDAQKIANEIVANTQREEREMLEAIREREDEILQSARNRAEEMITESEIVKAAEERAACIINDARNMATEMSINAYEYAEELLTEVKGDVMKMVSTIDANLFELKKYRVEED